MSGILSELASREGQSEIAEKIESGMKRFGNNFGSLTNALRAEAAASEASLFADYSAASEVNAKASEVNAKASETNAAMILAAVRNEYGYPFTAATAADMTDPEKIYVYTGSEAGYTNGNWYYHDGTEFVSGGVYNSTAFETDPTLSVPGAPADAGAVGELIERTDNLFDKHNANIINAYLNINETTVHASVKTRTLYIPCSANTDYVVVYNANAYASNIGTTATTPAGGVEYTDIESNALASNIDGRRYKHIQTPADAAYLMLYYYNSDHDPASSDVSYLDDVMIYEGATAIKRYIGCKSAIVNKNSLEDFLCLDAYTNMHTLADGTDFDSLTTPGSYKVVSAASAATMLNFPETDVGGRLIVLHTNSTNRLAQLFFSNSHTPIIYYRNKPTDGDWKDWTQLATILNVNTISDSSAKKAVYPTNVLLTAENYQNYFTSFNDAPANSIYGISTDVPLTDGPDGDEWIGTADRTSGYIRGTLLTLSQRTDKSVLKSNVTQILIGYRGKAFKPTISYRVGVYTDEMKWSAWSKFEENGYLHASNMIVYGGSLDKTFNDMNDMPSNTICQLDLNLDGSDADHTLANHPAPGVSCVAMCYAFSYTTIHGKVQTVYTIDGRLYWKYGYWQAANDYRWKAWRKIANDDGSYMQNQSRLSNNTDLNTVIDNSIHLMGLMPDAGYTNTPLTSGYGFLTTKSANAIILQTVEALNGNQYSRYSDNGGTTWSNWV